MLELIKRWVAGFSIALGILVLMLMMLQVVIDVFMRNLLGAGFPATTDLVGRYYMVAVSVLPLALTEIERRHIEATIFTQKLGAGAARGLLLFGFVMFAMILAVMTWGTTGEALRHTANGAYIEAGSIRFITWPSYWILPISFGLALLIMLIRIVELLTGKFVDADHDPIEDLDHRGNA